MSLTNRNSGTHFLTLSAYNRFRMFSTRRSSDSSFSDAESIRSEQGSTGDCLPTQRTEGEILSPPNLKAFTFEELKSATRNFCPDSYIGEGVFGYVFKGWIDEQTFTASKPGVGMVVAVKKFKPEGFYGHNAWLTEIRYLGQLHHPNLVKLIGFCSDGDNRLLVYEFMPGGSLDNHLFGSSLSARADVYRFGVMLLELLSGRRAFELYKALPESDTERIFVDSVRLYLDDKRKLFHIMDSKLEGQYPMKMARAMAKLVSACIDNDPESRPCMSEVSAVLEKLQTSKKSTM